MTDVRFEAADISLAVKKFTLLLVIQNPGGHYYVAATFNAAGGTAGTMSFIIEYVANKTLAAQQCAAFS